MSLFYIAFAIAVVAASGANAQSISIGDGKLIYQVLFSQWTNPESKLFTGRACGTLGIVISEKCDTQFVGYVDVLPDNDTRTSDYTWPGPKKEDRWPAIGADKYTKNTLKDFAYLNLTGVEEDKFREALLRVKVRDANLFNYAEINSYIGRLPGLKDLVVTRYESDAKFSEPIELEALSTVLPNARPNDKSKPDRATVQQQHLFVKVRAWGVDLAKTSSSRRHGVTTSRLLPPVRDDTDFTRTVNKSDQDDAAVDTPTTTEYSRYNKHKKHRHHHSENTDSLGSSTSSDTEYGGGSLVRNPSRTSSNYNKYRNSDTDKNE